MDSYEKFHSRLVTAFPRIHPPKLVICGHGSIDDPEEAKVHDAAVAHVENDIPYLRDSICIMRVRPSDQVLNTLMTKAKIALQLSIREGFEVKVSEALKKGKPVIATKAGGIPLQIDHGKNGFLVDVGDTDAVADHLFALWLDPSMYDRMSEYARTHVSDEVSSAGNDVSWFFLASEMSKGKTVKANGRWIDDLGRGNLSSDGNETLGRHHLKLKRHAEA